jgi:hypothetical protein
MIASSPQSLVELGHLGDDGEELVEVPVSRLVVGHDGGDDLVCDCEYVVGELAHGAVQVVDLEVDRFGSRRRVDVLQGRSKLVRVHPGPLQLRHGGRQRRARTSDPGRDDAQALQPRGNLRPGAGETAEFVRFFRRGPVDGLLDLDEGGRPRPPLPSGTLSRRSGLLRPRMAHRDS